MLEVQVFQNLISQNRIKEAIDFCYKMIAQTPNMTFYDFWLEKLSNGYTAPTSKPAITAIDNNADPKSMPQSMADDFKSFPYDYNAERALPSTLALLLEEKDKLVKSLPFMGGAIYLPTSKISLKDQVRGLRNVVDLVDEKNKLTSKNRFSALEARIKIAGKKRVFIVGNGPSLKNTDLELLKNEITIGFNGIFLHDTFKPTIYVVEDHLVAEDRAKEISDFECAVKIFPSYLGYCIPVQGNTIFLNHLPRRSYPVDTDFSDNVGDISYTGGTVTYTGLQIAASLGFSEIYLLGVDATYQVQNVERTTDYGIGILCSKSYDVNHFDSRYFGKGYRWHDPNVDTMMQAYRKVRNYAEIKGIKVVNATVGGDLDVFPRVKYESLFNLNNVYPKTAIIDYSHIDLPLPAGRMVKKDLFNGWAKHALFHVHGQHPDYVSAYQKIKHDCYASGADINGIYAALRSLMEYNPQLLYLRPTHDRHALTIFQLVMPIVLNKPFVIHYMEDWLVQTEKLYGSEFTKLYEQALSLMFSKANKVLTISKKMAVHLNQEFGIEFERIQVVHNYIQKQPDITLPKNKKTKVMRYFGGMDPEMSLSTIIKVAEATEVISTAKNPLHFEIYTTQDYIDRFDSDFIKFERTTVYLQHDNHQVNLALIYSSDLNLLCYNFDEKLKNYLKYSMANKLPEMVGANVPFLAIGSKEIGTITYLLEEDYPFVVTEHNNNEIQQTIKDILFGQKVLNSSYFEALNRIKEEFSAGKNQRGFQSMLRNVNQQKLISYSSSEIIEIKALCNSLFESLGDQKAKYQSLHIMAMLLSLGREQLEQLNILMRTHGIDWQFKQGQADLEKVVRKHIHSGADMLEMIAFLIISLGEDKFSKINTSILNLITGWVHNSTPHHSSFR
jgi:hypothetical protein